MAFPTKMKDLCTPAAFYFIISIIALVLMIFQNMGNSRRFCLGSFSCPVTNVAMLLVLKLIYILFWTWILNLICKDGYPNISWFLVLLPFMFIFVLFGLMMLKK
jgi:hypothetical protein